MRAAARQNGETFVCESMPQPPPKFYLVFFRSDFQNEYNAVLPIMDDSYIPKYYGKKNVSVRSSLLTLGRRLRGVREIRTIFNRVETQIKSVIDSVVLAVYARVLLYNIIYNIVCVSYIIIITTCAKRASEREKEKERNRGGTTHGPAVIFFSLRQKEC